LFAIFCYLICKQRTKTEELGRKMKHLSNFKQTFQRLLFTIIRILNQNSAEGGKNIPSKFKYLAMTHILCDKIILHEP